MSNQNNQDWSNLLAGQTIPNADLNTIRDAKIFRAALLAHADENDVEILYPHALHNILSSLKKSQPPSDKIPRMNLNQWLQGNLVAAIQADWLALEDIFRTIAFRNNHAKTLKRAKKIHLGTENSIILVIELEEQGQPETRVLMRLFPAEPQIYVPENIKFTIIPEVGEPLEEIAGTQHDYLEQDWYYEQGERFQIVVELNGICVTEHFEFPK